MSDFQDNTIDSSGIEDLLVEPSPPLMSHEPVADEPFPSAYGRNTEINAVTDEIANHQVTLDSDEEAPPSSSVTSVADGMMDGFETLPPPPPPPPTSYNVASHVVPVDEVVPDEAAPITYDDTFEVISTEHGGRLHSWPAVWLEEHHVDEKLIKLIYWAEWQKSLSVFGGLMFLLLSLTCYSFITVFTTFGLSLLVVSFLYRVGMTIVNTVQKTSAEHPLREMIDERIELSEESVKYWAECARVRINDGVRAMQQLFLINDFVESVKFGIVLWLVSVIGSWFSLLTMVIMVITAIFSLPKVYETYQNQIDEHYDIAKQQLYNVYTLVDSKIPAKLKFYNTKKEQ